jgi:uncharacterized protein
MSTATGGDGGVLSLSRLLSTLTLVLHPETYIFANIPSSTFHSTSFSIPLSQILLFFREPCTDEDRITLILCQSDTEQHVTENLETAYPCKMITCNVHSSLEAVGFMAVLATKLAEKGASCNPVSGFFHDHLFVPVEQAGTAVEVLEQVAREAGAEGRE